MATEKNLDNKVINEMKRLGISLVPFLQMTERGEKMLSNIDPEYLSSKKKRNLVYIGIGVCSYVTTTLVGIGISLGGVAYFSGSLSNGTPNFNKWKGIKQERITKREDYRARVLDGAFGVLDSDGDGVLSKGEFNRGLKEGIPKGYDSYSHLNRGLSLGKGDCPWR